MTGGRKIHSFLLTAVGRLNNLAFSARIAPKQAARKSHFFLSPLCSEIYQDCHLMALQVTTTTLAF